MDVLVLVESWHHSFADVAVHRAAQSGFHFLDRPSYDDPVATESGCGIIVYHCDHLKAKRVELKRVPTTFEALAVSLASDRGPTMLLVLHRPGSSHSTTTFYDELLAFLDQFALYNTQLVLAGDLNLHLEDSLLPETVEFVAILERFGLKQHVTESTRVSGGLLGVVTRDDCQVSNVTVFPLPSQIMDQSSPQFLLGVNLFSSPCVGFVIGRSLPSSLEEACPNSLPCGST